MTWLEDDDGYGDYDCDHDIKSNGMVNMKVLTVSNTSQDCKRLPWVHLIGCQGVKLSDVDNTCQCVDALAGNKPLVL